MYEIDRKNVIRSSELQRSVGKVLKRVAVDGESLIVERDGYPVAVMLPYHVYEQIRLKLTERPQRAPIALPDRQEPQQQSAETARPVAQSRDREVFFPDKTDSKLKGHKKHKH
jgi:PHD/YefM family antitoxin component YafN of YafNO toxin-antitoxin module